MKHIRLLAGSVAALVLAGCGGSNSSSSTSSTSNPSGTTTTTPGTPHIEAVVLSPTTIDLGLNSSGQNITNGQTWVIQDPNDIEVQDQVQFELVTYNAAGNRIVLPTSQWTSNDVSHTYGQIAYNNGVFVASTSETQTPQVVSVLYNGKSYSGYYQVLPRQVRLRGVLDSDLTHTGVYGVEIDFFGPSNPSVAGSPEVFRGRVMTAFDGSFRASIPPSTTGFSLENNTLNVSLQTNTQSTGAAKYQRYFRFDGQYYGTGFNTGTTTTLAPLNAPLTLVAGPSQINTQNSALTATYTATGSTSTTLSDTSLSLSLDQYVGDSIQILSDPTTPTAAGQILEIASSTSNTVDANNDPIDTFTMISPWTVTPDSNAVFNIVDQNYTDGEYYMVNYANSNINTNGTILLLASTEAAPSASHRP